MLAYANKPITVKNEDIYFKKIQLTYFDNFITIFA